MYEICQKYLFENKYYIYLLEYTRIPHRLGLQQMLPFLKKNLLFIFYLDEYTGKPGFEGEVKYQKKKNFRIFIPLVIIFCKNSLCWKI